MFFGFRIRFTSLSLALHVFCMIALAVTKFESKNIGDSNANEITICFDVVSSKRNIKTSKKLVQKQIPIAAKAVTPPKNNTFVKEISQSVPKEKQIKIKDSNKSAATPKVANTSTFSTSNTDIKDEDLFALGEFIQDSPESVQAMEYVKGKIEQHRNFVGLCAKGLDDVEMIFEIGLNTDGSINFAQYLGDNAGKEITQSTRQALICQNLRAIQLAAPFAKLNLSKHKNWQRLRLRFTQH
jgi:hypothetical protein